MAANGNAVLISIASEFDARGIKEAQKQLAALEKNLPTDKMAQFGASVTAFGGKVSKLGGTLTKNLTLPLAAAGAAFVVFAKEAEEATIANAKLDNVLTSMGFEQATDRAINYAEELERTVAVDAEVIKATQTKLATFANLTATVNEAGGAFDRATLAALDLAAAGFGSAETNATQLGKALQDPIKGITALARSGVTFTEQEKEKIKALVESGKLLDAQNIVLSAIEKQVGGTAKAGASGFERIRLSLLQVAETIGMAVLPLIQSIADTISNTIVPRVLPVIEQLTERFNNLSPTIKTVVLTVLAFAAGVGPLLLLFGKMISIVGSVISGISALGVALGIAGGPLTLIIAGVAALTAAIVFLYKNNEDFRNFVHQAWASIREAISTAITIIRQFIDDNRESINQLRQAFGVFADFLMKYVAPIVAALIELQLKVLIEVLKGVVLAVQVAINIFNALVTQFKNVSDAVTSLVSFFDNGFRQANNIVTSFKNNITDAFRNASTLLYNVGRDIVMGLWNGLQSMTDFLVTNVTRWIKSVLPDPIERALGISSPSKKGAEIGFNFVEGLIKGLNENAGKAVETSKGMAMRIGNESSIEFAKVGALIALEMLTALIEEISPNGKLRRMLMNMMDNLAKSLNRTSRPLS